MTVGFPPPPLLWTGLAILAGLLAGIGATWLWLGRRHRIESERQAERQREITLEAQHLQYEMDQCRSTLHSSLTELNDLRQRLLNEIELRAGFQQAAKRTGELEAALSHDTDLQDRLREQISVLKEEKAALFKQLEYEQQSGAEKVRALTSAQESLRESFQNLAGDALKSNNRMFLDLARETLEKFQVQAQGDLRERQKSVEGLVAPLHQVLAKYEQELSRIERERQQAYTKLTTQAELLSLTHAQLQTETSKLVKALGQPQVRGRWGEITLQRVVELAGMTEHCDFQLQAQVETDNGRLRPDMLVCLPSDRMVAVDSKVPLRAYLEAMDSPNEEERRQRLREHGRHIRSHIQQLGSKQYWSQFAQSPEFVVLFLPGESFFSAALQQDPHLIEYGIDQKVILATPTTLIALLKSVAYGWQQRTMAQNARTISELGRELHSRLATMIGHFQELGKQLQRSIQEYNRTMGALERRVLVSARKLAELGAASGDTLSEAAPLDDHPRIPETPQQHEDAAATDEGQNDAE